MKLNYLALAVPMFLLFIYLEYVASRRKGLNYFNSRNTIANLSIGIAERLLDVFVTGYFFFFYDFLQKNYGLFDIKPGILLWLGLFIVTDFIWYWYHRLAHEISIFWAVHVVHHQSEDFNYSVSARITVFQAVVRTGFWSVLPLIGFPASMITTVLLVHGLYPFFIHTQMIGRLGILEYILVTPSHHRVHHASNPEYLDKNYGDVLIIWDKLFGTFKKEEESRKPVYGLTEPLNTYSFLWQHFHFIVAAIIAVRRAPGWRAKFRILFGRPDNVGKDASRRAHEIFRIRNERTAEDQEGLNRYVTAQMAVLLATLFFFILFEHYMPLWASLTFLLFTFLTLINCGAIMEQKKWIFYLELARVIAILLPAACFGEGEYIRIMTTILSLLLILPALNYRKSQQYYLRLVYKKTMITR